MHLTEFCDKPFSTLKFSVDIRSNLIAVFSWAKAGAIARKHVSNTKMRAKEFLTGLKNNLWPIA
jgi:hypothetical protein